MCLNVELHNLESLVRVRLVDGMQENLGQDITRYGGGIDPHIPLICVLDQQAFDFRIQRTDLRDPLDDVDATIVPLHAEDTVAILIKRSNLDDRPHSRHTA